MYYAMGGSGSFLLVLDSTNTCLAVYDAVSMYTFPEKLSIKIQMCVVMGYRNCHFGFHEMLLSPVNCFLRF